MSILIRCLQSPQGPLRCRLKAIAALVTDSRFTLGDSAGMGHPWWPREIVSGHFQRMRLIMN
ncbi:hypothetical protein [Burkholderia glumae]